MSEVERMKAQAVAEKHTMVRIMVNCHPQKFGMDPYKARAELLQKSYKQLKKLYEETMGEKWVYDPEFPWQKGDC